MQVSRAAVVGAGTMGGEIAQAVAAAGIPVVLKDVDEAQVETGLRRAAEVTENGLQRLVAKGRLSREVADERAAEVAARIEGATDYARFGDVELVVEAVPERMELKEAVFAELDAATPGHAVLASNTSALSIEALAAVTTRPERVVGMHFFWPASVMRLVEVIEGFDTAEDTAQAAVDFARRIGKQPVRCRDTPGFVVNRILLSALSEAWRVQSEAGLGFAEVDAAMTEAGVMPMGPFALVDLVGLDTTLHVAEHLREQLGDRFVVSPAMAERVRAGRLGQKSGGGFYGD